MSIVSARTSEPIPGYHVTKRIGAGGYGEVWAAQAPGDLNKAIKFVYGLLDEDRAARELKALNRIKGVRHPFLLSLERIEVVDGQLLIVTELADGSLKDRFDECRKANLPGIPRAELLSNLRDAADALDFMTEQHSLQHLDVKPENLLLLGGRIKVADFGLVKDIQDHTASMMGGLTPVYAPPEVFEGRPSRRSDQYSLAIVFQEMLTGVLPFPGRTAAQLAAQHLNAKPRVSSLPPADQPVIARALSKKPADRFNSCRELVEALVETGKQPAAPVSVNQTRAPALPVSPTLGATQGVTAARTPATMLRELDDASQAIDVAVTGAPAPLEGDNYQAPALADLGPAPALVDLPPCECDLAAWTPRPTLFLGLGGTGARVLTRLRHRLADRLDEASRARFPILVLDSDSRDLDTIAHEVGGLTPAETLALPLRRTQDYRNDSREILQWLSRRWLYNIPRSQLTEGMRPLGRLALVDHAGQAMARLRTAITELAGIAAAATQMPRVVIVAAASGGTGGGMLTDTAFAVRQFLDELKLPEAEVLTVLGHATNRNPQQQELSAVNTLASLTELAQFHRTPYPGEKACGLAARSADVPAVSSAYVVHMGEELSPEQFQGACDRVAEFLLLDSVTPAGAALAAARRDVAPGEPGLRVRTFGLIQIGFAHDQLVAQSVCRTSRGVVERWLGEPRRGEIRKSLRLVPSGSGTQPLAAMAAMDVDAKAVEIARAFGLEIDPLMQAVRQLAADQMGGDPEAFFQSFLQPKPTKDVDRTMLGQWLAASGEIFGRRQEDAMQPTPARLKLALEEPIARLVGEMGPLLRPEIEKLVDVPAIRVHGAQQVAKALQKHLRHLADQLRETRNRLAQECQTVEQQLWAAVPDPKSKTKPPRRSPAEIQTWFLQLCRLKLLEFSAQAAGNIAHAVQSHAVSAYDGLVDLARELHQLAVKLATDEIAEDDEANEADDHLTRLKRMVGEDLRRAEERLALELDQQLSAGIVAVSGGLQKALVAGGAQRETLVTQLNQVARQAVLKELAKVDIAGVTIRASGQDAPLRECLAAAQPWLGPCGGKRRLLCIVPTETAEGLTPGAVAAAIGAGEFKQLPAVIPDTASDVVLLFEIGDLSLRHAAAAIIGQRPDMAELATRLFTRSDVTWTPLVG